MRALDPGWKNAVEMDFWSYADWRDERTGRKLIDCLRDCGFVPSRFGDEEPLEPRSYPSSSESLLQLWRSRPDQLIIQGHQVADFEIIIHLNPGKADPPHSLAFAVHEKYFQNSDHNTTFLKFAETLYKLLRPTQGDIGHRQDRESKTIVESFVRIGKRRVLARKYLPANPTLGLSGVYWANFFGPAFVDYFSKEKLDSAPCYHKKILTDGGYLLTTSESPLDYRLDKTKMLERSLIEHLGSEAFLNKNYPGWIARSPLSPRQTTANTANTRRIEMDESKGIESIRSCPSCSESDNISEFSRDQVNRLVSFRCLKCGTVWAAPASLIGK